MAFRPKPLVNGDGNIVEEHFVEVESIACLMDEPHINARRIHVDDQPCQTFGLRTVPIAARQQDAEFGGVQITIISEEIPCNGAILQKVPTLQQALQLTISEASAAKLPEISPAVSRQNEHAIVTAQS